MKSLHLLCQAVRTLHIEGQIRFHGIPDREDWWVCIVSVGDAIITETQAGPIEDVIEIATARIQEISERVAAILESADSTPKV